MKMILFIAVLFILGCNAIQPDPVKAFIPGTYYSSRRTAFSHVIDTITIVPFSSGGSDGFLLTRRTHLEFIGPAKNRVPEYAIVKWTGTYEASSRTVLINATGRVLYFDPNNKMLQMGTVRYQKL